uniref:AIG1-type G domain-containing protein n=1 Tax=Poecilia mexicana TaxID=48701 RepID=A0A3B3XQZ7_9TELE
MCKASFKLKLNNFSIFCFVGLGGKVLPNHLRIVMIGGLLAGKSSTGNTILEKNDFYVSKSSGRTTHSEISHGLVEGRRLTVVDSPGWFCFNTLQETSEMDKLEIENSVNLCPPGPHAVLLVIDLTDSIEESYLRSVQQHMNLLREEIWKQPLVLFTYGDWLGVKTVEERVWRHCMVVFTRGDWINDVPVENYIVREGKELQELLEKCGNRYHVLNPHHSQDPVPIKDMFQKIFDIVKQNRGCFTIKAKEKKSQILRLQEKGIEEEWKRREQELIERMMKALSKEPEEPTEPHVRKAWSKDDRDIPDMSGDVASEYGSISEDRRRRGHDQVAEWLNNRVRESEISSGIGSICSSATYMDKTDESSLIAANQPNSYFTENKKDSLNMFLNTTKIRRRNSC